ncbi:Histone-binding protein rbbp4 [Haplosporangium bisporale]|nr:Histone-binding protein rbbp4 [Haplosporangium bisporale]
MSFQPQRSFGPVKPWLLAKNIPKKVSAVRLSNVLGLGRDDKFFDRASESSDAELVRDIKISLFEATVPHCMSIIAKHNYTTLEGTVIRIELAPLAKYNDMHEVYVEVGAEVTLKDIFDHFSRWGFVAGVFRKEIKPGQPPPSESGPIQYHVFFTTKQAAFDARQAIIKPGRDARRVVSVQGKRLTGYYIIMGADELFYYEQKYIKDHDVKFIWIKNVGPQVPDFWVPPVIKGNVIAVPINVASAASASVGRAVTSPAKIHADWCNSAFVAYETLYNMSARSDQGKVSISSIAWGSQLDISTFRMHYGSKFTAAIEPKKPVPVVSSSTVEMRQYGDKDSAAEVLCLESGHLVTSTEQQGLHVWDMKENTEKGRAPIVLDPNDRRFSIRGNKLRTAIPHPLTGCEWNPHNPHEFMTTSVNAIRIWDARKMSDDVHCRFYDIGDKIQKAQWSPHKPDVFGILGQDGLLRITKLQIPPSPPSYLEELNSEDLFIHLGHTLCVTDFAWCPYLEDVICTVAAGFDKEPGGIQVWRPRNLYDLDDNEEP